MNPPKDVLPVALFLCLLGFEAGCSTVNSRIDANPVAFDRLAPQQQALVREGHLAVGFPPSAVKLAVGDPKYVTFESEPLARTNIVYTRDEWLNPISGLGTKLDIWHYQSPSLREFVHGDELEIVYDRNGLVASFEQEEPRGSSMVVDGQPQSSPTPDEEALVKARQVAIGFDVTLVKLALGNPDRVTLRTDAAGSTLIWHYEDNLLNRAADRTTIQDRLAVTFDSRGRVVGIEKEVPPDFGGGADHQPSGSLTRDQQALLKERQVGIGFDRAATRHVLGDPDRATLRTDAGGAALIWHYEAAEYEPPRVFDSSLDWRALPYPMVKMRFGVTLAFDEGGRVSTINEAIGVLAE
jgi:hypothetical protein